MAIEVYLGDFKVHEDHNSQVNISHRNIRSDYPLPFLLARLCFSSSNNNIHQTIPLITLITMAVIRVGLVGLTSIKPDGLGPHAWAVFALLPVFLHSPDYELVALCNSSLESARRAIEAHGLPSSVKAYGNPEDLAKDPDVDLIVISVRVGKHFEIAKPALLEGKKVFVEWPLGASTEEAETLTALAREKNIKTIVGVQARADPLLLKVREIIQSGKLGRITSAHALGSTSSLPSHFWFNGMDYYQDIKSGGNLYHINFAHCMLNTHQTLKISNWRSGADIVIF